VKILGRSRLKYFIFIRTPESSLPLKADHLLMRLSHTGHLCAAPLHPESDPLTRGHIKESSTAEV
jgi:hypothetical protein